MHKLNKLKRHVSKNNIFFYIKNHKLTKKI